MIRRLAATVFSAVCFTALSAEIPAPCAGALRRALDSSADWTMARRFAGSGRVLATTGVVECVAGEGIAWKVLHPFASSVTMTTNSMIFADEDGERVKPLEKLPYYGEIRARTDAFARGETDAFEGLFKVDAAICSNGNWRMEFVSENKAMRRLFSKAVLSGGEELTSVLLTTEDGGSSEIRFKGKSRDR